MSRYTVYLDEKTLKKLREIKEKKGVSITFMINQSIKEYLSKFL